MFIMAAPLVVALSRGVAVSDGLRAGWESSWSSVCSAWAWSLTGTKNYEPVAALHTAKGAPDQYPIV
ncbi:MAG TPA: hypothetical protein VE288_00900 [Rubrobacteraceae bacterium]|nr:hypothetical protein [Rubrobacteraceae bacterium]